MNYKEKKEQIERKYVDAIRAIGIANDCDMGVAYEKFKNNIMEGGKYPYVNFEELRNITISSAESAEKETNSAENTAE